MATLVSAVECLQVSFFLLSLFLCRRCSSARVFAVSVSLAMLLSARSMGGGVRMASSLSVLFLLVLRMPTPMSAHNAVREVSPAD